MASAPILKFVNCFFQPVLSGFVIPSCRGRPHSYNFYPYIHWPTSLKRSLSNCGDTLQVLSKCMVAVSALLYTGHSGNPAWFGLPFFAKFIQVLLTLSASTCAPFPPPVMFLPRSTESKTKGSSIQ